ncbi:MATE family efflux transporter [Taibaiella lutea]|uniref:MATE family efflux transporter n=1 Tax=Taibaiella lutea TaxID=2608001 RepID=UPI001C10F8D1|nr:MATE family efflux transporter [Taibaiella lutea]
MLVNEAKSTMKLALPIIFGELAQMALHIIDTAMIGNIGNYKQLAAAALVMSVINIPFVFGIGITFAVSQMVSMAHGRRDGQLVSHYFYNGFWLCAIAALIISGGLELGKNILFHLGQDAEVARLAVPFLQLMGWSIIPMILFMALKQFTDGLEFTRTAMLLSILALPINVFINWLLIFGNWGFPRLELVGAGFGTLITRSLVFIVLGLVILSHKTFRKYVAVRSNQWKINRATMQRLLQIGVPSSLQIGMEAGAFCISGIIIGTISPVAQAAHQIALVCASFTFMVSMGLAQGGSIRTSNAFGRKDWTKINAIGRSTLIMALMYGIFCAVLFTSLRNYLPAFFTKENETGAKEVASLAGYLLLFAAIFQISDSTQAVSAGLLRGIKDVKTPTILIAVAYWVVGIPFGYIMAKQFHLGAVGIWLGFIIGLTLSSLFLSIRFLRISGKNKLIPG